MARIKKYAPTLNEKLTTFQTFIVDTNPNSDYFRIRSKIQFYRYSFISKKNFKIKITDIFFILIGYVLYFYDIINYKLIVK